MMWTVAILKHAGPVSRLLRRDVEERGERVHGSVGAHLWLIGQANKFVATYSWITWGGRWSPNYGVRGRSPYLGHRGPSRASFLTGDRTRATRTRLARSARRSFVYASPPSLSCDTDTFYPRHVTTGNGAIFFYYIWSRYNVSSWVTRASVLNIKPSNARWQRNTRTLKLRIEIYLILCLWGNFTVFLFSLSFFFWIFILDYLAINIVNFAIMDIIEADLYIVIILCSELFESRDKFIQK